MEHAGHNPCMIVLFPMRRSVVKSMVRCCCCRLCVIFNSHMLKALKCRIRFGFLISYAPACQALCRGLCITCPMRPITHMLSQTIQGQRTHLPLNVLMDPGSDHSYIHEQVLPKGAIPKIVWVTPTNTLNATTSCRASRNHPSWVQPIKTYWSKIRLLRVQTRQQNRCRTRQSFLNYLWYQLQWPFKWLIRFTDNNITCTFYS